MVKNEFSPFIYTFHLHTYFFNDLPQSPIISLNLFADDTKAYVPLINDNERLNLQETINKLLVVEWSEK